MHGRTHVRRVRMSGRTHVRRVRMSGRTHVRRVRMSGRTHVRPLVIPLRITRSPPPPPSFLSVPFVRPGPGAGFLGRFHSDISLAAEETGPRTWTAGRERNELAGAEGGGWSVLPA
jgi:hypothetical protein